MTTRSSTGHPAREATVSLRAITITASLFAVAFCFATGSTSRAGATCTVCHKRNQTLTYPCNFSEYFRHLDHGDPPGPCNGTPPAEERAGGGLIRGNSIAAEAPTN